MATDVPSARPPSRDVPPRARSASGRATVVVYASCSRRRAALLHAVLLDALDLAEDAARDGRTSTSSRQSDACGLPRGADGVQLRALRAQQRLPRRRRSPLRTSSSARSAATPSRGCASPAARSSSCSCSATLMIPDQLRLVPVFEMLTNWHLIGTFSGLHPDQPRLGGEPVLHAAVLPDHPEGLRRGGEARRRRLLQDVLARDAPARGARDRGASRSSPSRGSWNDFFWPLIIFGRATRTMYTLQLGLAQFTFQYQTLWPAADGGERDRDPPDRRHLPRLPALLHRRRHGSGGQGMRPRGRAARARCATSTRSSWRLVAR